MVVGLHGDSMVLVVKAAVEEYNTNVDNAKILHPKKAVKTALDQLHCLVTVTHTHVLVNNCMNAIPFICAVSSVKRDIST